MKSFVLSIIFNGMIYGLNKDKEIFLRVFLFRAASAPFSRVKFTRSFTKSLLGSILKLILNSRLDTTCKMQYRASVHSLKY